MFREAAMISGLEPALVLNMLLLILLCQSGEMK